MARNCKTCLHPDRKKIEDQIARGVPYADIVAEYKGYFTAPALSNHKIKHMGIENKDSAKLARMDFALMPAIHQTARVADMLWDIATVAKQEGKLQTAVSALKEYRAAIALKAQLTGEARAKGPDSENEFLAIMKRIAPMGDDQIRALADKAVALASAKDDATHTIEGDVQPATAEDGDEPY